MGWAANWYKQGDVVIGRESVSISTETSPSVVVSKDEGSVTIGRSKAKSVIIRNNQQSVIIQDKTVSVSI